MSGDAVEVSSWTTPVISLIGSSMVKGERQNEGI